MQVVPDLSWQWRPDAAITACDSTQRCTAIALQYPDSSIKDTPGEELRPETESRDVELQGHGDRVTSLKFHAFHESSDLLLASGSSDRVIVWHLNAELHASKTVVVEKPLDEPTCVEFDQTGTLLAVACDREVEVRIIHTGEILVTLEGHLARITACAFHPLRHHLLFTCSEDRTFKIWNLATKSLLFQSAVLSAFPILSLALNPSTGDASVGFGDGTIKVFTVHESVAREHATLNVETFMRRLARKKQRQEDLQDLARESPNVASSLPPWARSDRAQETAAIQQALASNAATRASYSDFSSERSRSLTFPSDDGHVAEVAYPVLSMRYLCVDTLHVDRDDDQGSSGTTSTASSQQLAAFNAHGEQELLTREQFLVVAVPSHLLAVNAFSLEIKILHDFQSPFQATTSSSLDQPIAIAKDLCFHAPDGSDLLFCGVVSAFMPCFTMVCTAVTRDRLRGSSIDETTELTPCITTTKATTTTTTSGDNQTSDDSSTHAMTTSATAFERISVISTGPPPKDSVLNLPPLTLTKALVPPSSSKTKTNSKSPALVDKPITFRTRIKSSGYGTPTPSFLTTSRPRPTISERKTGTTSSSSTSSSSSSSGRPNVSVESFLKEYPTQCGLLTQYQQKHALPPKTLHHGAIHQIEFSSDAKWLASGGNDKIALVSRLPFSKFHGDGNVFSGHDHAVRSVHWSHNNQLLLTTSSDKTSRVWLTDSDMASLTLHGGAPKTAAVTSSSMSVVTPFSSAKKAIKQDMVDALFFYMDKFILSASGNTVRLHQFEIDVLFARAQTKKAKKNDLLNDENKSKKKKVAQYLFPEMQAITAVTCVNGSFLSSMVIAAGSDRSLRIVDAAVGKTARVIRDAHARAAHTVALPRASCFVSHPSNFYDLLLSSAPSNAIHLWDIRADNCVMRFGEHVNRVHQLGVAFSPCMRYVATGSEDRLTYLYDIRTGRCLNKLTGHTDVVTSVAFNPLHPQLATASYDGTMRFYTSMESQM